MKRYKYPRTLHVPWSPGATKDDKIAAEVVLKDFIFTEKMDGECTTIYSDGYTHARSTTSNHHWSRSRVKQLAGQISSKLPIGYRLVGENVYATHSIEYSNLENEYGENWFFQLFAVIDEVFGVLSWEETKNWAEYLEIPHVPVWRKVYNPAPTKLDDKSIPSLVKNLEGYVVRNLHGFRYEDHQENVFKYVRAGHVQTDQHWMHKSRQETNS